MKALIRDTLEKLFPVSAMHYRAYRSLVGDKNSYLYSTGWMQSLKERKPIDSHGNPIPWMNFPTIRFLEEKLTQNLNLFEFGSGYSTFFYASKVKAVTSVEHNEKWVRVIQPQSPENVKVIFQKEDIDGGYCRVIGSMRNQYDVVIVDGRDRVNCIKQSISALSPKGVIVLDDSQREEYQEGIEFAKRNGFRALNLEGLKARGAGVDRTTVFYRQENCFGI